MNVWTIITFFIYQISVSLIFAIFVNFAIKVLRGRTNYFKTLFILAANSLLYYILSTSGIINSMLILKVINVVLYFILFKIFFKLGFLRTILVSVLSYVLMFYLGSYVSSIFNLIVSFLFSLF